MSSDSFAEGDFVSPSSGTNEKSAIQVLLHHSATISVMMLRLPLLLMMMMGMVMMIMMVVMIMTSWRPKSSPKGRLHDHGVSFLGRKRPSGGPKAAPKVNSMIMELACWAQKDHLEARTQRQKVKRARQKVKGEEKNLRT